MFLDTHAAYTTLKKQAQEMEARLKKANEILAVWKFMLISCFSNSRFYSDILFELVKFVHSSTSFKFWNIFIAACYQYVIILISSEWKRCIQGNGGKI